MSTKYIYIIRHAETVLNEAETRQGSEGGLSERGKSQADAIGERLKGFHIGHIFASSFQRGVETAEIINKHLNVEIEKSDLLVERRNPKSIIGKKYTDPIVVEMINMMDRSYHKPDFRIEDEENFMDLKERALKLRKFLEANAHDKSLCVTHATFLKMFLCIIKYGEDLTLEEYIKNSIFNPASNAGITVLELKKSMIPFGAAEWKIILYNETLMTQKSKSV